MTLGSISFLITSLVHGGAETQLLHIARSLKKHGWKVQVISLTPPKVYLDEFELAGIPVASLNIRRKLLDPLTVFRLARLIRSWNTDIVHCHMVHANLFGRLVRPLCSVPVLICTAHSIDEGGHFREILYRLTDPFCDLTTQVSQAGLERYVNARAVPQHKIRCIPNCVDTGWFKPNSEIYKHYREEFGLEGCFVWLTVGRFSAAKDYPNMLEAFAAVAQERPEAKLMIAGYGTDREAIEKLANKLGLNERVQFLGIIHNVPKIMNIADGYVLSSAWEGMPLVLLEASAMGLPIVATDVGGNREVIQNGETGFLVPPKDPRALSEAMFRIMNLTEVERRRIGSAGREYIEANYSLDHVVEMWEELYHEILDEKVIGHEHTLRF
jgi:glycosyltransferase involved in cell wall biosynthesis